MRSAVGTAIRVCAAVAIGVAAASAGVEMSRATQQASRAQTEVPHTHTEELLAGPETSPHDQRETSRNDPETPARTSSQVPRAKTRTTHTPDQDSGFVLAATHPQAREQPTDNGMTIATLTAWQGQIYSGYGDYGANTGPISISPFDPATGEFTEVWVTDTEAVFNYRPIRGRLYAPAIDRRSRADYAVGEPWSDHLPIVTTHAYDMVTVDGDDLWMVGSLGYSAAAWRSTDDGGTWEQTIAVPAASGADGDFARFYFAGTFDGRLFLQAIDYPGGQHPHSIVGEAGEWSEGPDLLLGLGSGWRPIEFSGRLVYRASQRGGKLLAFDGQTAQVVLDWTVLDTATEGQTLYALASHQDASTGYVRSLSVLKTADLRNWLMLQSDVPGEATSLAVLDGEVFLGTKYAELWRFDGAPEWRTVVIPPGADTIVVPHASR